MIPPIIHQIWFQFAPDKPATPPVEYDELRASWRDQHPNWTIILWNEETARRFLATHYPWFLPIFDGYSKPILKVDSFRIFALHHYGGWYVDCDCKCIRTLAALANEKLVVIRDKHPLFAINNAVIGTQPNHPFLLRVAQSFHLTKFLTNPLVATGPIFLTLHYLTYHNKQDIKVLKVRDHEYYFEHYYHSTWH